MANLIIQENGVARTRPAVTGEEITIKTPCSCSDVTGVQINGVVFPFYDAMGNILGNTAGLFNKDSLIRVLLDADNTRAYILNADNNAYLEEKLANKYGPDNKPTAEDLGVAPADEHKIKHYYTLSQIGITPGDETIGNIGNTMPNYSMLMYFVGDGNNTDEYPSAYGLLRAYKVQNSRVVFEFTAHQSNKFYYGVCYNGTFQGWTQVYDKANPPSASDITAGTLAVARGGTGVTANPSMLTNLASTAAAGVFAASPRPGVTGTLPVANGGTGATTISPAVTTKGVRAIYAGTTDMTAGTTALTTGTLYFVYE